MKKSDRIKEEAHMCRIDYIFLAAIVSVYSFFAFFHLGDMSAPQTSYHPSGKGETFEITFEHESQVSGISYYYGIGDVGKKPKVELEFLNSAEGQWKKIQGVDVTLKSVFKWEMQEFNSFSASKIRGTSEFTEFSLYELAFWDENGNIIPIASIAGNGNFHALVDEQELVPASPSYQNSTYFDEIYHPRTAFEMLHHLPYYEYTHPPLGKAIMSLGIAVFGMTPFGWRVMGTLFGIFMIPFMYLFLKKLLRETRYAVMGTLLFSFDFMHFSLTRMGTIDSYPVFFILVMYYFMYLFGRRSLYFAQEYGKTFFQDKKRKRALLIPLALSGIAWGCGAASKWIGVYAGVGLLIEFIAIMVSVWRKLRAQKKAPQEFRAFAGRICAWCTIFFILIPAIIYTASYIQISMIPGYGNVVQEMWRNQFDMLSYHGNLEATHSYSSKWFQWPIVYRPLWAYQAPQTAVAGGNIGCISIMGNPVLYWTGIAAFFAVVVLAIKRRSKKLGFLLIALLAQYLPWACIQRTTFIYHFFATTPFMIIMIAWCMKELESKWKAMRTVNVIFCVLCLGLFGMFYPVLSGTEVSRAYVDAFLRWSPKWVFYN